MKLTVFDAVSGESLGEIRIPRRATEKTAHVAIHNLLLRLGKSDRYRCLTAHGLLYPTEKPMAIVPHVQVRFLPCTEGWQPPAPKEDQKEDQKDEDIATFPAIIPVTSLRPPDLVRTECLLETMLPSDFAMRQLHSMGFTDACQNQHVLEATNGNLEEAMAFLISEQPQPLT